MTERARCVSEGETIHILHVDDDACFLETAKPILEMQGAFQIESALSVEEAVEKMKKEEYDAVVSDYQLPGKDGLQFLKELRQKGNNIPFIIFTGKGREEVAIKALNLGADHYENKNGDPETVYSELSHDITNAVRTRRAEQELRIQREELQVILDSMPAKIWYKDRDNRLVRVNKAFAEYMGVSKENLEGKPLCDLFPPDIAQKCWEEDKEVITTGQPKTDILDRHESAQGVRWFSTGKVPCREKDGNIIGTINFSVDITERKKAEEALGAERDRLEIVTESIGAGLAVISEDYHILWANRVLKRIFGDVEGKICYSTYHRRSEICPKCGVQEVFEAGKNRAVHEQVRKDVDGKIIWTEIITTPIKDKSGKVTAAAELGVPVTERKKVEVSLQESEERFRAIVENAPFGYYRVGKDGLWQYVNPMWERMHGLSLEEVVGKSFEITQTEDDVEQAKEYVKRALAGETIVGEFSRLTSESDVEYHSFNIQPIKRNNEIVAIEGFINDITERKKAEEALRNNEEKWRSLAEGSPDHIMLLDLKFNILYINRTVPDLKREEVIGTSVFNYVPPERHRVAKNCFKRVIETGKTDHYDTEYRTKDGEVRYFDVRIGPVFQENRVIALISSSTDITGQKKAEKEFENMARFSSENPNPILRIAKDGVILYANTAAKSLGELKIEIGQPASHHWRRLVSDALDSGLRKEIEVENEDRMFLFILTPAASATYVNAYGIDVTERNKALERMSIVNEKLGVVGKLTRHDVRNKLSTVIGNTYLTKKTLPNDHKALTYLKKIELACEQTTRVLDFAAAYESLGAEGLTLMDVSKAVEEAVSLIAESKGVNVVNNCQGLTVMADSALRQLFFNLDENSLKHGKNVSQIEIYYEEGKDRLKLFYEDNGIGIPKANKPKLFDWGFNTGKGSGHGLPLIKSMMEIYGWTIEEEGEPGKGARFVMTIPNKQFTILARNSTH